MDLFIFFGDFVFRSAQQQAAREPDEAPSAEPVTSSAIQRSAMHLPLLKPEQMPPTFTGIYRAEGRNPGGSAYRGMVAIIQEGDQFTFRWWIGSQIFQGTGQLAGRMLVVNWGDAKPVVYTVAARDVLDGEWADGAAMERLTLFGRAADSPMTLSEGAYEATGFSGKGGKYHGTVQITRQGEGYHLDWKIGSSTYAGDGELDGNLLTVRWSSSTPVVYALAPDGSLTGLWNAGAGEEILTPQR